MLKINIIEFKKYYKKNKKHFRFSMIISLMFIGNIFFYISYHNLDLLQNYSLIYNSINLETHCSSNALDVRQITDCTASRYCPDFQTIYLNSKFIQILSFLILNGVLMNYLLRLYKNAISKRS